MPYQIVTPIVDFSVRTLCQRPYPNHPRGCLNYGKRTLCPPKCRSITRILDFEKPIYAIWNVFDFATHCQQMKQLHPVWTRRQVECCLYWQPKARKQLKVEIQKFLTDIRHLTILTCPEATGVNVTATMASIGQELQWPPETITYQVALAGTKYG